MKFLLLLTIFLFSFSCSQKPVRVSNNYNKFYGKQASQRKYLNQSYKSYKSKINSKKSSKGEITISSGDTLYGISKEYKIAIRDLIEANNLEAPYMLKSGSKLKIPTSITKYHEVEDGDTLFGISRKYDVKANDLVEMNNLEKPYIVKKGQKIIIAQNISNNRVATIKTSTSEKSFKEKVLNKIGIASDKFLWPIEGKKKIISTFGPKSGGLYNDGINLDAKKGDVVKSAQSGVVAYVGNELKGYGNLIIIKHSGGWITAYAHLDKYAVQRGQKVSEGESIGFVGQTGNVNSAQLYFGLRKGREAVNPLSYLPK
jgi:murein DD-endopeptidase MepM/ murein hydrolase activator NlpD